MPIIIIKNRELIKIQLKNVKKGAINQLCKYSIWPCLDDDIEPNE